MALYGFREKKNDYEGFDSPAIPVAAIATFHFVRLWLWKSWGNNRIINSVFFLDIGSHMNMANVYANQEWLKFYIKLEIKMAGYHKIISLIRSWYVNYNWLLLLKNK